jgi:hypothetical protein
MVQPRHQPLLFGYPGSHALFTDDEAFVLQFVGRLADGVPRDAKTVCEFNLLWQEEAFPELLHANQLAEMIFHLDMKG